MKNFRIKLFAFVFLSLFVVISVTPNSTYAQFGLPEGSSCPKQLDINNLTYKSIGCLLTRLLWIFGVILPVPVFTLYLLYSLLQLALAKDNASKLAATKKTFTYSILGLILILGSLSIIAIISSAIGVDLLNESIPDLFQD